MWVFDFHFVRYLFIMLLLKAPSNIIKYSLKVYMHHRRIYFFTLGALQAEKLKKRVDSVLWDTRKYEYKQRLGKGSHRN